MSEYSQTLVYAAGSYEGRRTDWITDQSGERSGFMRVAVNSPERPMVLLLGAYEPTVWHIGWTEGTQILAVSVGGYHRQTLVGLPQGTRVLNNSFSGGNQARQRCRSYFSGVEKDEDFKIINGLSKSLTGRVPDGLFSPSSPGKLSLGPPIPADQPVFSGREVNQAEFDRGRPLEDFLETAVRRQQIRPAAAREYVQWFEARNKAAGRPAEVIKVPAHLTAPTPWNQVWAYVVLEDDFRPIMAAILPELTKARSFPLTFYLPAGSPSAEPIAGTILLNLEDGSCLGRRCGDKQYNIKAIRAYEE